MSVMHTAIIHLTASSQTHVHTHPQNLLHFSFLGLGIPLKRHQRLVRFWQNKRDTQIQYLLFFSFSLSLSLLIQGSFKRLMHWHSGGILKNSFLSKLVHPAAEEDHVWWHTARRLAFFTRITFFQISNYRRFGPQAFFQHSHSTAIPARSIRI